MGTVQNLEKDTIARCSEGKMEFLGIPERFLKKVREEKCFRCMESSCAMVKLVMTRAQWDREEREDKEEIEEATKSDLETEDRSYKRSKLQVWGLSVKRMFQLTSGKCLIDPSYKCKSDLTLGKKEYEVALAKQYLLPQLLRFFGWLSG